MGERAMSLEVIWTHRSALTDVSLPERGRRTEAPLAPEVGHGDEGHNGAEVGQRARTARGAGRHRGPGA